MIDQKALTQWNKASISYNNYQEYINKKEFKKIYKLTIIDLLYISNFKGGNASIHEEEKIVLDKLKAYSKKLIEIKKKFKNKSLSQLTKIETENLISLIISICVLTNKETSTKIDGFSDSYLSALLSAHFPNLIPILDRRILINLNLVQKNDIDKSGQIKNIRSFYPALILELRELSQKRNINIREIDKELFIQEINKEVIN
jgi:hypothetical protein